MAPLRSQREIALELYPKRNTRHAEVIVQERRQAKDLVPFAQAMNSAVIENLQHLTRQSLPEPFWQYVWVSPGNRSLALESVKSLVCAAREKNYNLVSFFASTVLDLYNRDRAELAGSLLREKPKPIREIPREITVKERGFDQRYFLRLTELVAWDTQVPDWALARVNAVVQQIVPDKLHLATYVQYVIYDPLVYAQFGAWYVELAHWD